MLTYKEFTDKEITKNLECHINAEDCISCEMFGCCEEIILTERVLDLINRQKSEIERLNKKVEELSDVLSDTIRIRYAEAKIEAYKEFAERLKQSTVTAVIGNEIYAVATSKGVDNILKEMMGDKQ